MTGLRPTSYFLTTFSPLSRHSFCHNPSDRKYVLPGNPRYAQPGHDQQSSENTAEVASAGTISHQALVAEALRRNPKPLEQAAGQAKVTRMYNEVVNKPNL